MKKGKFTQAALDRLVLRPLRKYHVAGPEAVPGADSAAILPYILSDENEGGSFPAPEADMETPLMPDTEKAGERRPDAGDVRGRTFSDTSGLEERWTSGDADSDRLRVSTAVHEVGARFDLTPEMVLTQAVNSLAVSGSIAVSATLNLILPEGAADETVKEIAGRTGDMAEKLNVTIVGGHTAVSEAVSRPILSVTAYGLNLPGIRLPGSEWSVPGFSGMQGNEPGAGRFAGPAPVPAGSEIVMAGFTGTGGTIVLAQDGREPLSARFPLSVVEAPSGWKEELCIQEDAAEALTAGCLCCHDISEGGVFGALWELAERGHFGLDADLKKIPIRQETVEICEYFDLNPYQLFGQGAFLSVTARGDELCERLSRCGRTAAVIGTVTDGNARRILNGEDVRYLEKTQQDMLWQAHL